MIDEGGFDGIEKSIKSISNFGQVSQSKKFYSNSKSQQTRIT
jgi:hypothetical protein